jgi:PAS domain-containing protein
VADAILPQALSNLIGSIYDCALDPARWEQTLADVGDALECHILNLSVNDLRDNRLLLLKSVGMGSYYIERLPKYVPEVNAILGGALASWRSLDEPHVTSRHLSSEYIETSWYFQEFVKPTGTVDTMRLFLMHTPLHLSFLSVSRSERQGIITEREIELGKLLLPHLRRAVTISKVHDVRTIVGARMAEALDALRCAVVLTNEHGTILHANRSAEHMLDEGGPIQSSQGILQATAPSATSELRSALAFAARNEAGIGKTGLAIRLTEPDVPPIFAHVLPAHGKRFPHPAATLGRCGGVYQCATRRARWCRHVGCCLWSDAGRNQGARQPVRRAPAERDRRNAQHHQADGENPPRTHLPEDQGDAPGRADAFVDRADLPDRIEDVKCFGPLSPECTSRPRRPTAGRGQKGNHEMGKRRMDPNLLKPN